MEDKLSVLVQIDLHGAAVRLVVTGRVTEANQPALHPLIARARRVLPEAVVTVDLTGALHVDPVALELLRATITHAQQPGAGPVEVLTRAGVCDPSPARDPGWPPPTAPAGCSRYERFHRRHPAQRRRIPTGARTGR